MTTPFTDAENIAWEQTLPAKIMSACLAIRYKDTVLMVKASYKDHWSFPGGVIDEHESPLSAAVRETREETGVEIAPEACKPFHVVYTAAKNGHRDRLNFAFTTTVDNPDFTFLIPNDEIEEAQWVPTTEVAAMANNRQSYQRLQLALTTTPDAPYYSENL